MNKLIVFICLSFTTLSLFAQDTTRSSSRSDRREEKRERVNAMIKQDEEGVLVYQKQSAFGLQLRTDGYGIFYEMGRMKTPRRTNLYLIELTEIKHPKEEKTISSNGIFGSSFIYGKINNFYQLKLGFGQQYILGQKGNKNGVAVMGVYQGGLSLGFLRPYYLTVFESGVERTIKYQSKDSLLFLTGDPAGVGGLTTGWGEMEFKPGAFVKAALRFDFGRFNETVQAVQIGASIEGYSDKIEIMAPRLGTAEAVKPQQLFFQGHIAFMFGRRK